MAGYSGTPLLKKLGVKTGYRVALVNAPRNFREELGALPATAKFASATADSLDLILAFVSSERELKLKFGTLAAKLQKDGMIWVAWPKKSSGVVTDLSFN